METPRLGLAGADLSVTSFVSSSHPTESCGINGLPLTPHSTSILGAGQLLLTCEHNNLARYLDIQRGKHQRIILVVETWPNNLSKLTMADIDTGIEAEGALLKLLASTERRKCCSVAIDAKSTRPHGIKVVKDEKEKIFAPSAINGSVSPQKLCHP